MLSRIRGAIAAAALALAMLGSAWAGSTPLSLEAGPAPAGEAASMAGGHPCPEGRIESAATMAGAPGCCIAFCQVATLADAPALSPVRGAPATGPSAGPAPPVSWPPPLQPPQA